MVDPAAAPRYFRIIGAYRRGMHQLTLIGVRVFTHTNPVYF